MNSLRWAALIALALAFDSPAQSTKKSAGSFPLDSPLLNPSGPGVYIEYKKVGSAPPLSETEGRDRIWLSLKNNTRWTIAVRTFGLPDGYDRAEAGLMFDVEADPAFARETPVPNGYNSDVATMTPVRPGEALPFSVPKADLDSGLHIRVEFYFAWELNWHNTRHFTYFGYWDLPKVK